MSESEKLTLFGMFPVEILEILFKYSDGIDIINFRHVCKMWNHIIARLSENTDLWEVKCKNEIPLHFCKSISEKLYPNISWLNLQKSDNNLKWLSIYKSWIKWQRIKDTEVLIEQFEPFFIRLPTVKVTCVTVSENLLAVGSSEGFVAFYDIDHTIKDPIFTADQMEYVSDVKFLRDDKRILALSSSDMHRITSWDVKSEKAIGVKQYGVLISTTHGCVWISKRHKLSVQNKNTRKIYEFLEIYGTIVALVADGDQAFVWTDLGYNYKINLNDANVEYVEEYVEPPTEKVCKYYLFAPWIAMCITSDGFLGISVNSERWVMFEILSKLHGVPTCVLFYANLLVLGLDSGSVHIYYVGNVESLTTWDFRSENSKAIVVDNQAIVALDIVDRPKKHHLIAATSEKVNIIEFTDF